MSDPDEKQVEPQAVTTTPTPAAEMLEGEPFDAARAMKLIEKLRAENKELKPKAKQAEELAIAEQKRKEAEMTELQKMTAALEKANAELRQARLNDLRREVAIKAELPLAFADRLRGETPEELEADAKKLLEALPKAPKPPRVEPTNPGSGASTGETVEQQRARIHGQTVNVFDPTYVREHGGGVVIKDKRLAAE